jgi:hypothetical protein
MFRTSLLRISIVFLIVSFTAVSHAQTSWQLVTDNEAGFSISFPGQPTYQTTIDPATGKQVEVYKFSIQVAFYESPSPRFRGHLSPLLNSVKSMVSSLNR